jgi:hypothetical protein
VRHLWVSQVAASKFGPEIMRTFDVDPAQHDDIHLLPLPVILAQAEE